MKRTIVFLFLTLAALLWGETVINGSRSILGAWNAGGAASTIPAKVGTAAPAACTVGEQFFDSDAAAGSNILLCTATNTWTAVSGGGGGITVADVPCLPGDLRWFCIVEEFPVGSTTSNQIGTHGWRVTRGTVSAASVSPPYFGALRATTGTTSGNGAGVSLVDALWGIANNWHDFTDDYEMEAKWVFKLVATDNMTFRIGVYEDGAAGIIARGAALYGTNGGNFQISYTTGLNTETQFDLGVPLDTNWHTFRIRSDGTTARKFYFRLDNGTERTLCESGCDINTSSTAMWYSAGVSATRPTVSIVTNTSAARSIDVDYFSFKANLGGTGETR